MELQKKFSALIDAAIYMECTPAVEAGTMAFLSRNLILATMPHSKPDTLVWERRNGNLLMEMVAHPRFGLPYGSRARLLLAWIITQAVRTKEPIIDLGKSATAFIHQFQTASTGGDYGSIRGYKEQLERLLATTIRCEWSDKSSGLTSHTAYLLAEHSETWWDPVVADLQGHIPETKICLSSKFFEELLAHPVPLDMRALFALKRSPLALDIYCWLTYRYSTLQRPAIISWKGLELQFGSAYKTSREFRRNFRKQLERVKHVYPRANIEEVSRKGMKLMPSPTHITSIH